MYCPKCGKEIPEGSRFCMHCGADLSGYKVEVSPKIDVSPKIEVRTNAEKIGCDICGERKAIVTCKECGRTVCNFHFEGEVKMCTLCAISHFEGIVRECEKWTGKYPSNDAKERIKWYRKEKELHEKKYMEFMESYRKFGSNWWLEFANNSRKSISLCNTAIENEKKIEKLKRKLPPELR